MDEILPPGESLSHPFDNYINSVLDEAYRTALNDFPIHLLDLTNIIKSKFSIYTGLPSSPAVGDIFMVSFTGPISGVTYIKGEFRKYSGSTYDNLDVYDTVNGIAYIEMPENFVRIGQFKFTDWTNHAKKHINQESQEFKYIENGTITGGKVNPMVAMVHEQRSSDTTVKKYLACYSVTTIDENPKLWYVKYDKDNGLTSLSDYAIPGIVWKSCSLLMQIFNMKEMEIAEGRYKAFISNSM
jgi:hypothetical protein